MRKNISIGALALARLDAAAKAAGTTHSGMINRLLMDYLPKENQSKENK